MSTSLCESLVAEALESSPLVSVLVLGLARAGCPVSLLRHVSCEPCQAGGSNRASGLINITQNLHKKIVFFTAVIA